MSAVSPPAAPTRRALLRWAGWFALAHAAVWAVLGLRYLRHLPLPDSLPGVVYTVCATLGHYATLGLVALLPAMVLALAVPRPWLVRPLGVLGAALLTTLLVVDGNVFAEHRYHLTPLTVAIFAPATWVMTGLIGLMALAFASVLAGAVARWVARPVRRHGGRVLAVLALTWLVGQGIHAWGDAIGHTGVTALTRYLPGYFPIHAKRRLAKMGLVDPTLVERRRLLARTADTGSGPLQYPLAPLRCAAPGAGAPRNVLLVLIDALRPDVVDAQLTPRLAALAVSGQHFTQHYSGGNSSRAGLFSLFYGLPSTYLEAFYGIQRGPVLIEEMRAQGYAFVLHAAPGFGSPTDLNRTVFAGFDRLPLERKDIDGRARNRAVSEAWVDWLARRDTDDSRPFFAFLYYDPPMGEMAGEPDPALPLADRPIPAALARQWAQYRRGMQFADAELGRVLDALERSGLAADTLVLVTSDHGYEFDDSGQGHVGHANAFSPAQLRATLVMRWPGRPAERHEHRSAHFDVVPTLMRDVLGCTNPPADYSSGGDLHDGRDWPWLVAGSYGAHAIVEPQRVVIAHPGGYVEVLDAAYRPVPGAALDSDIIAGALAEMRRFYR